MAEIAAEVIAELAIVEPPVEFSKTTMYDEMALVFGDFIKVLAARKAGIDPFPDPEPILDEDGKKKRDKKNRPPRAPSAYNIFMKGVQDQIKAQYPELKQTELMKHIAAMWNGSDEKKVSDQRRAEAIEAAKRTKKTSKTEAKAEKAEAKAEKAEAKAERAEAKVEKVEAQTEASEEEEPKSSKKASKKDADTPKEKKASKKRANDEETPSSVKKGKKGKKGE